MPGHAPRPAVATCQTELDMTLAGGMEIVMVRGRDDASEPLRVDDDHGKEIVILSGRVERGGVTALVEGGHVTARGAGHLTVLGGTVVVYDNVRVVAFAGIVQMRGGRALLRDSVSAVLYVGSAFVEQHASIKIEGSAAVVGRHGAAVVSKAGRVLVRRDGRAVIISGFGCSAEVETGVARNRRRSGPGAGPTRGEHLRRSVFSQAEAGSGRRSGRIPIKVNRICARGEHFGRRGA